MFMESKSGRPHTFYSDASRTWLSPTGDRAVNRKPLNSLPEHYETIHYHDATYYNSLVRLLAIKTPRPIQPVTKLAVTELLSLQHFKQLRCFYHHH